MKRLIQAIIIVLLSLTLTSCNFTSIFTDTIETSTLNYISTIVINSNLKVKTETYTKVINKEITGPLQGTGSGVIIKRDGTDYYLLTNSHVVYLSDDYLHRYTVEDSFNNVFTAVLVFKDEKYDLAVLKFESTEAIEVMTLSEKNPKIGDIVFSVGSPLGKHNIITAGKIIAIQSIDNYDYKIIIHEAIIRNGSSGSMLINEKYEIVGLNTWGFIDEGSVEGYVIGGAIPVEKIREFLVEQEFE